ncbi:MAG: AbrB/MazE/SpoVT family DNA-binding domain-containing protein [Candidatus Hydrothermarchaeales archaeon]
MEAFKAKIRKFGNSLGVIIPKEWLERERYKEGDIIELAKADTQRKEIETIVESAGMLKGRLKPFRREKGDRYDAVRYRHTG